MSARSTPRERRMSAARDEAALRASSTTRRACSTRSASRSGTSSSPTTPSTGCRSRAASRTAINHTSLLYEDKLLLRGAHRAPEEPALLLAAPAELLPARAAGTAARVGAAPRRLLGDAHAVPLRRVAAATNSCCSPASAGCTWSRSDGALRIRLKKVELSTATRRCPPSSCFRDGGRSGTRRYHSRQPSPQARRAARRHEFLQVLPHGGRRATASGRARWTYAQAACGGRPAARRATPRHGYGHGHRAGLLLLNRPAFLFHFLALNALGVSRGADQPGMARGRARVPDRPQRDLRGRDVAARRARGLRAAAATPRRRRSRSPIRRRASCRPRRARRR